jgi:hypothetical protein
LKSLPNGVKATHLNDPDYPLPTRSQFMQWMGLEVEPQQVAEPVLD